MLEEIIANEWAQAAALILTIVTGIYFLWEKIFAGTIWIVNKFKNTFASFFGKTPTNPFGDKKGRIENPSRFFEQKNLLNEVFGELEKGTSLSLIGGDKTGKSSLLYHVSEKEPHFFYLDMQNVDDESDFFKALCDGIGIAEIRGYEMFRNLKKDGKKYVLCIDNIECLTNELFSGNERTRLRGLAEGADAPLTLLIASRRSLNELFLDSSNDYSPLYGICHTIEMPPFSQKEVHKFIETRLHSTGKQFAEVDFKTLWQESQGHPARVQEVAKALFEQRC
jgi:hypothetical protein